MRDFTRPKATAQNLFRVAVAAAVIMLGTTPFISHSAGLKAERIAATDLMRESSGIQHDQLAVYPVLAKANADRAAVAAIAEANTVIVQAQSKVDAEPLASSVASLQSYATLDIDTVRDRTEHTTTTSALISAAAVEFDRLAAVAAAEAAAAEAARVAAEAAAAAELVRNANTPAGAKANARSMASSGYGWGADQFSCLDTLWQKESGWNYAAYNKSSGATGIVQALPGSKMASAGADWATNATTQISWGLTYIEDRYGSPCSAMAHSRSVNWY